MRIDTPSNLSKKPPETVHYQGRTPALQQIASLFDHLVGGGDERRWHGEAERPGGLKVDHKLELGRRLNGQVGGFVALEDTIGIRRRTPKLTERVNSVGQQAADVSEEISARWPIVKASGITTRPPFDSRACAAMTDSSSDISWTGARIASTPRDAAAALKGF